MFAVRPKPAADLPAAKGNASGRQAMMSQATTSQDGMFPARNAL
jgi:hypothetical protein